MDLGDRDGLRWLSAILGDARSAAPDVDCLIVGAMARDLLLHYGDGVPITRATTDVDLGVAVASWENFRELRHACLQSGNFTVGSPGDHRLVHRSAVALDLIPFGGVERKDGTIVWPNSSSVMGVLGFHEARATAINVLLPDGVAVRTVCLPMLIVLKLMAWSERHTYTPQKDASDLFLVLDNYLNEENTKRLYDVGAHLFETADFDYGVAGAWLAGYDSARCLADHSEQPRRILTVIKEILDVETDPDGNLQLVGETGSRARSALALLTGFRNGIASEAKRLGATSE